MQTLSPSFRKDMAMGLFLLGSMAVAHCAHAYSDREIQCVRKTVYGEAHDQPFETQVAVAATIINRGRDDRWPDDLCDVVKQRGQFAGYHKQTAPNTRAKSDAWDDAATATIWTIARYDELPASERRYLYFNTAGQTPHWKKRHKFYAKIGGMEFYGRK